MTGIYPRLCCYNCKMYFFLTKWNAVRHQRGGFHSDVWCIKEHLSLFGFILKWFLFLHAKFYFPFWEYLCDGVLLVAEKSSPRWTLSRQNLCLWPLLTSSPSIEHVRLHVWLRPQMDRKLDQLVIGCYGTGRRGLIAAVLVPRSLPLDLCCLVFAKQFFCDCFFFNLKTCNLPINKCNNISATEKHKDLLKNFK